MPPVGKKKKEEEEVETKKPDKPERKKPSALAGVLEDFREARSYLDTPAAGSFKRISEVLKRTEKITSKLDEVFKSEAKAAEKAEKAHEEEEEPKHTEPIQLLDSGQIQELERLRTEFTEWAGLTAAAHRVRMKSSPLQDQTPVYVHAQLAKLLATVVTLLLDRLTVPVS